MRCCGGASPWCVFSTPAFCVSLQVLASVGAVLTDRASGDVYQRRKPLLKRVATWFGLLRVNLAMRLKQAGVVGKAALDRIHGTGGASPASVFTTLDKTTLYSYVVFVRDICWHISQDQFCHSTIVALVNDDLWSCLPTAFVRQLLCTGNEQVSVPATVVLSWGMHRAWYCVC